MSKTGAKSRKPDVKLDRKAHKWRPCSLGKHWVSAHTRHRTSGRGLAFVQNVRGHCRTNRSHQDHLYRDDIREVAEKHFSKLSGPPVKDDFKFYDKGNRFDSLIRGWTQYWNDVLKPKDPLDPDVVKALIATESSFNPKESNHRRGKAGAHGLMQVLNWTVQLLKDLKELKDHFVNLDEDDMEDPNLNICAGVRWLFRKKEWAEARAKRPVSWRDAVAAYKGVSPNDKKLMPRFDDYLQKLKRRK